LFELFPGVVDVRIVVKVGDLLDEVADVLITTANPWLNMSGGVNGAILLRDGAGVQAELRAILRSAGVAHVPPGTVCVTGPGSLEAKHLIHAVAIDGFYSSSVALVATTIERALAKAVELNAQSVAMPALATGYGPLEIRDFAAALSLAYRSQAWRIELLTVVLRRESDAEIVRNVVAEADSA
jgi:O-acetyl-ADP-ribose deacetylase (regulator of RNase III)